MTQKYISVTSDTNMDELVALLKQCNTATIDNDCIYFASEDTSYELPQFDAKLLLIHMLGVECELI